SRHGDHSYLHPFPTRRSSDLRFLHLAYLCLRRGYRREAWGDGPGPRSKAAKPSPFVMLGPVPRMAAEREARPGERAACPKPKARSEEHTSELQSREKLVCRLL